MEELLNLYKKRKGDIKKSLEEFSMMKDADGRRVFLELCFCLCTPQSKALACWDAVKRLDERGILFSGEKEVEKVLYGVRFHKTKAKRIVRARDEFLKNGKFKIKKSIEGMKDDFKLREWLVKNVNGLGMKEASHFMRNVGRGKNVAILDRHILKNLYKYGAIDEVPRTLTQKKYEEVERKMKKFADKMGIPIDELDLLFWSEETGFIFK